MHRAENEEFREALVEFVEERRANGGTFVKATHVTREFDVSAQEAGLHLQLLADRGHLDRYNPGSSPATWRILSERQ